MDQTDKKIQEILTKDISTPYSYSQTIQNALYQNKVKKRFLFSSLVKTIATASAAFLLITGVVYAKDIGNFIYQFFNPSKGIDTAVEKGYIAVPNMNYANSNNTKIKVSNLLMDDYNLSFTFSLNLPPEIDSSKVTDIRFNNMLITDEENRILYCETQDMFEQYCKANNLNYTWKETNENYMNNGINSYLKQNTNKQLDIVYNLYANGYPKSKELFITITEFQIFLGEKGSPSSEKFALAGNWQMDLPIPEQFYNRENVVYRVKSCSDETMVVTEANVALNNNIKSNTNDKTIFTPGAVVHNTCMKLTLQTQAEPVYLESDSPEVKEQKVEQYRLEQVQQMFSFATLEEAKNALENGYSMSFKNEEEKQKSLSNQLFGPNPYVENERGQKFYPIKSNNGDCAYLRGFTGKVTYWQTFALTKYDITDILTVHLTYNGKDIVIELQRK